MRSTNRSFKFKAALYFDQFYQTSRLRDHDEVIPIYRLLHALDDGRNMY